MRTIAALSVLIAGVLATDNYVRVENGKVVAAGAAASLPLPSMRSEGGSGDGNVFNGQIGITDALNPNSPLSIWLDDLLNPESDPYKQAVVDAMKILLTVLLIALGGLGVDTFTVLVLGFSQGSIIASYQVQLDSGDTLDSNDIQNAVIDTINDANTQIEGYNLDNSLTTVGLAESTVTAADCASCWVPVDDSYCIPDPAQLTLSCNPDGMELRLNTCIMGLTDLPHLTLSDPTCDESSGAITMSDDNTQYVAVTPLDACSTTMEFKDTGVIEFNNMIQGNFAPDATGPDAIINTYDRYSVSFTCDYATTYDDIGTTTNVTSSLMSGPVDGEGALVFSLNTYTDSTFGTQDTSGTVRVGTTLYFTIEILNPITDVDFSVTDCTVSNTDKSLSYDILTNRCPNNRVNFNIITNKSGTQTQFSYTVFEFKNDNAATLHLSCNIVVCQASDALSTCASTAACGRRRRRSFDDNQTYYRVAKDMVSV